MFIDWIFSVCMYVCMFICICTYVCICVCVFVCINCPCPCSLQKIIFFHHHAYQDAVVLTCACVCRDVCL